MHLLLLSLACTDSATQDSGCELSTFYLDADGDGFGDDANVAQACEAPPSHIAEAGDCDDLDAGIYPGAQEVCSGVDEDCDGLVDNDDDSLDLNSHLDYFRDADGDGYGDTEDLGVRACEPPEGMVADSSDCDDALAGVNPGATEVCDDLDNDCDALIDDEDPDRVGASDWYEDVDGDGYGVGDPVQACEAPESDSAIRDGDCDDADGTQYPGAEEVCGDGVVNDCDGELAAARAACPWGGELSTYFGDEDALVSHASADDLPRSMSQGDVNGDGWQDYLIGGWVGSNRERSRVVLGPVSAEGSTEDGLEIVGESSDYLGTGNLIADVDGDGQDDLLIGAVGQGSGGAFYMLKGPITANANVSDAVLTVNSSSGQLGTAVALLGDQSGDGITELALGASDSNRNGSVYVVSGALSGTQDLSEIYSAKVSAPESNDYAGQHDGLGGATDVDGDGVYDLVMGVPYGDLNDTGDGYVSIWSGQISGDLSTLDADIVLSNSEASSYAALGSSVKGAFDWDGDGYDDLFVGAPRQDIDDGSYSGAAFIVLGPITGDTDLASADIRIEGADGDYLGGGTDIVDVDGDGQLDLFVGGGYTQFSDGRASYSSGVGAWLFLGPGTTEWATEDADLYLWGTSGFGIQVAAGPDQNGDGELELLVLHGDDDEGVYLFLSPDI